MMVDISRSALDNSMIVTVTISREMEQRFDHEFIKAVCDSAVKAMVEKLIVEKSEVILTVAAADLAHKLVADKGQEIIAKVPLETVLNRVVAEAVRKIGNAAEEPKK